LITRIVENAENFGPDFGKVSANKKIQIQNKKKKKIHTIFQFSSKILTLIPFFPSPPPAI